MSNHSHLHEIEVDKKVVSIDAFGTRDECDHCREKAGLPPLAEVQRQLAARGVDVSQVRGGIAPSEEMLADLEDAEATIVDLRAQIKAGNPELAAERDTAVAENGQLKRQVHALEQQVAQIPALEQQLQQEREKVASLEQSLSTAKPKK